MLSGTFSGLNLGLMSLTEDDLNVIIDGSSDPRRQLSFASLAEFPPPATPPLRTLGILNLDGYYYPTQVASAPRLTLRRCALRGPQESAPL